MSSPFMPPRRIPEEAVRETEAIEAELRRSGTLSEDARRADQLRAPKELPDRLPRDAQKRLGKEKEKEREKEREKEKKKKKKEKKREEQKALGSNRGIETMFRTTYQSHNDLVALADQKANIMISVNGVIISILLVSLLPRLLESRALTRGVMIPIALLLLGCVGSMVCAVLAARPRVTRNPATLEDVKAGRSNLLFFANFLGMPVTDYLEAMRWLMTNPDEVYLTMLRNLYALGHILEAKFRLLWLGYTIFLAGLGLAGAMTLIVLIYGLIAGPPTTPQVVP